MNTSQKYEYKLSVIYFTFRVLLAICLAGVSLADQQWHLHGNYQTLVFLQTVGGYFCLAILNLAYSAIIRQPPLKQTIFAAILIDVVFCLVFLHLSGGFRTGLAILLLSPITIASIFFYGSVAFFMAAVAIVGMLLDVLYMASINVDDSKYFVPAGLLGILFFITSLITQAVARHIRTTENLALENIEKARNLGILNETIVQRMLTGIIVVDMENRILLSNDIAKDMLETSISADNTLQGKLLELHGQWQDNERILPEPFRDGPGLPIVRASFSRVVSENGYSLIFIENQSVLNQQAQHLKLSSLGRLSASIAHEIRNPLNAISHASQLLLESSALNPEDLRLLSMINNHTKRINGIISNVLDISRRAPTHPGKLLLRNVVEKIEMQLQDANQRDAIFDISIPDGFTVVFDESQLTQVLFNLIDNALRYSAEATGIAWVKITAGIDNGIPEISIFDRGRGIHPDEVEKVFEPFYTTHKTGTGLGLYVARELCEMNQAILDYLYDDNGTGFFNIRFAHPDKNIGNLN